MILLVKDIKDGNKEYWLKMGDITEIAHEVNVLTELDILGNSKMKCCSSNKPNILTFGFLAIKNYKIKCRN